MFTTLAATAAAQAPTGTTRVVLLAVMFVGAAFILGVLLPTAIREGNRVAQAEDDAAREDAAPQPARPATYLPTPDDAPVVTVYDARADEEWLGVIHDGLVHDASGIVHPDDIGWRFQIERDGADITDALAGPAQRG